MANKPEWENPPTIEALKNDFRVAKSAHDEQMGKIIKWRNILNVKGDQKPHTKPNRSSVQPRVAKKQAVWRYGALSEPFLNTPEIFSVEPRTFEDREAAHQNELLLNYQFDTKINKIEFINKLIHRVVDDGTAIIRVGWEHKEKTQLVNTPVFQYFDAQLIMPPDQLEQYSQQIQQLAQLSIQNPRQFNQMTSPELKEAANVFMQQQQLVMVQITGYQPVPTPIVLENHPTVTVMRPENVFIDPSCEGVQEDIGYVIYTFQASKSYLQTSGEYFDVDKINWDDIMNLDTEEHFSNTPTEYNSMTQDPARKKAVVNEWWGFYDIHNTGELVPIVASWVGDTLIRLAENPFPDQKLPFIFIAYLPVIDSVYGEPDAVLLEDPQRITGAVYRGMIDLLGKSANSQRGFVKGGLDAINRRRFYAGEDFEYNPSGNPAAGGYLEMTYPEIPVSAMNFLQLQNNEAESLTGIKAFTGGISGDTYGRVVAAANYAHDAAANVEMDILRRIAHGIQVLGSKIIAMNSVFLSDEEVIRVTNKSNAVSQEFISIHPEDIQGNFDCKVDIKTAKAIEDMVSKLAMLFQTVGPNADFGILKIGMSKIADLLQMPDMAEAIRNYEPQPDPMMVENQRLQNLLLQSQIELNGGKTQESTTKAQRSVLEVQEEVSGINHARKMEELKAQADSQEVQTIIKGMMQPTKNANGGEEAPDVDAALGLHLAKDRLKKNVDEKYALQDAKEQLASDILFNQFMGN